ncbi:hypothetical protein CS8_022600 [Cupriavidus sp. 8B]
MGNRNKKTSARQFKSMLHSVAELTTTQFEELQATMERMRTQDTHNPSIGMGHRRKSEIVNEVAALPGSGQTKGIGIPGRPHFLSPTAFKPAAKEPSSSVSAQSGTDWSLPATADDPQKAYGFAVVVKVAMVDDATVFAEMPGISSVQYSDAMADQSAFAGQQRTVFDLLLEGLPGKVVAQRLAMSEKAVKDQVNAILGCLGGISRKQAILIARRRLMADILGSNCSRTDPGARDHNDPTWLAGTIPSAPSAELGLTQRQGSVLNLLLEGLPNKLIARRLGVTVNTVKEHVSAILLRLNLRTRAEVISRMNAHVAAALTGDSWSFTGAAATEQDCAIELAQRAPVTPESLGLTHRQASVLNLLLEGLPNKIIAQRLGLTENTVKEHVSAILQRLDLRTRTEVISRMTRIYV